MSKCILPMCARDASAHGYCKAHALRKARGMDLETPFRKRTTPPARVLLEDVIAICENGGSMITGTELAALFRRLGK